MLEESSCPDARALASAAEAVWAGSSERMTVRLAASERLKRRMLEETGEAVEAVFITDSDMRHIKKKHGADEVERGQVDVRPDDFALIPEILSSFDSMEYSDTDKLGNRKYLITKRMDADLFLVTVQRGKRKLEIKTFWKRVSGASC